MSDTTPNHWREVTLDDVADEVTVGYVGSMTKEYIETGIPWLRNKNVHSFNIDWDDMKYVSQEFHTKLRKSSLSPGDVVIVRTGKPGAAALIPDSLTEANCSDLVIVRCGEELDKRFCVYYLNSAAKHHIHSHLVEAVQQHFNVGAAKKLKMQLPPLEEQRAIASILGALDDKIELNRRMNATLESLARAIFKSWFVDFDPVNINAGQMPASSAIPTTHDPKVLDLFPSTFQDSQYGEIPSGWNIVMVSELTEGLYDGPHATPPTCDEGPVFLGIKNLTGTALDLSVIRHISEDDWPRWTKRVTPQAGDVVFSYEATLGYLALIPEGLRCCLGRRLALVRPVAEDQNQHFLFHTFTGDSFQRYLLTHTTSGATVDRVPLTDFPKYPVLLPPKPIVRHFEVLARKIWSKIHTNQSESSTLSDYHDALLHKLLSGELPVPECVLLAEEVYA